MTKKNVHFILLVVAVLWGVGITVTKVILDAGIGVFEFIFIRFLLGALALLIFDYRSCRFSKSELKLGILSGCLLFMFFLLQTLGLEKTSVTNTALYTGATAIIAPFIAYVISNQKIRKVEISAALLLILALFINNLGGFTVFNVGDVLVLVSAFVLALNICVVKKYLKCLNITTVTFISFVMVSLCALLILVITGCEFVCSYDLTVASCFLYLGILTTALAFIIQNKAVFYTSEAKISFILGSESVWGVICASFIYNEPLFITSVIALMIIMCGFILISKTTKKC